jgi:ankyrin repeat protein
MKNQEKLKIAICKNDIQYLKKNMVFFSINERFSDENNDTLLLYAISDSNSNIYKYFLENGANYNLVNDEGENIIHAIVFSGETERFLEVISNYKVNINHQAKDGATPLLLAISIEKYDLAILLIKAGADVNLSDNEGLTPLHLACQEGNQELVNLLIEKNANLKAKTKAGNVPMSFAANQGHDEIVKILYRKLFLN